MTDIGAKLTTVAIGIRIGITIGIGLGSVETVLHIIIESNFIGIGVGIGVGQWKHTIRGTRFLNVNYCLKSHNAHTKHRERLVFAFADCIDIFVKDFFSPWQVKLVDIVPELTLLRRSRSPEVKNSFFLLHSPTVLIINLEEKKTTIELNKWRKLVCELKLMFNLKVLSFRNHNDKQLMLLIFFFFNFHYCKIWIELNWKRVEWK